MSYEKHLLRDRRFWPAFWVQFFGAFNDNVFKNALVLLITYKSYSLMGIPAAQMVAMSGGIFILPFFLFSATAGQICDKYPKHTLMKWIKVWEILAMAIGTFGFMTENVGVLMGTLFFMGLQSTFFGPVKYSILPAIVEEDELIEGNALFSMGTFVSILLGTIFGGILVGLGESATTYVSLSVLAFACIGTLFSFGIKKVPATTPEIKVNWWIIRPTIEIIKITKSVKSVWLSILGISWFWFFGAVLLSMFPVYVKEVIYGDTSVATLFLALFSIGVAVGAMLCEKFSRERLELGLVPFGSIGMSVFLFDLFFIGRPTTLGTPENLIGIQAFFSSAISYRVVFDLFMLSVFGGMFIVPLYTFIQQRSDKKELSRIIAGNNIINALFMVVSAVFMMVLYGMGYTPVHLFLALAILNTVVAVYIYTVIPEFLYRFVCFILSRVVYRVKASGQEHIPTDTAALVVCNHVSFVDWMFLAAEIKRPPRFVMDHNYMKNPIARFLLKGCKVIPIASYKESQEMIDKAFAEVEKCLNEGHLVVIFPEGVITRDGKIGKYRSGFDRIIEKNPVPVIPMTLHGLWGSYFSRMHNGKALSNHKGLFKFIPRQVELKVYPPIKSEDIDSEKLEIFTKEKMVDEVLV